MIRKLSERIIAKEENLRGGNLTVTISKFLTQEEACGKGRMFAFFSLPPKGSIGFHQHVDEFEVYVITKGKAAVTDNDKVEHLLEPGDTFVCEDGKGHAVRNAGDGEMEFLAIILFTK